MMNIDTLPLDSLPGSESDILEYKSSLTDDEKLKREVQQAASAFWNGGGGIFIAGVDKTGVVDGGIGRNIARQTREDWLSQVIGAVHPQGTYRPRLFEIPSHPNIAPGKCVLAIAFDPSTAIPHQAADSRYYIRVGAHTLPAPHFIVDALYAKRHFRSPKLVHLDQVKPFTTASDFFNVEVIAATDGVALDVVVDFDPRPNLRPGRLAFPLTVPIVDRAHPFAFRFEVPRQPPFVSTIKIAYLDFANNSYAYEKPINASTSLPPWNREDSDFGEISEQLRELRRAVERLASN
jgi:hypothetical protein